MTRRLFLAIPLPTPYLDVLGKLAEKYNFQGVRWTFQRNLHITALFLVDVKDEKISPLAQALDQLANYQTFELKFKGLSFAPPRRPPRMIWVDFEESPNFDNLTKKCFLICKSFCHVRPPYKQTPHITLARFQHNADYRHIALPQIKLNPLVVEEIRLMESVLTPQGPIYSKIKSIKLKKNNGN